MTEDRLCFTLTQYRNPPTLRLISRAALLVCTLLLGPLLLACGEPTPPSPVPHIEVHEGYIRVLVTPDLCRQYPSVLAPGGECGDGDFWFDVVTDGCMACFDRICVEGLSTGYVHCYYQNVRGYGRTCLQWGPGCVAG